jgi:hypothetical protein
MHRLPLRRLCSESFALFQSLFVHQFDHCVDVQQAFVACRPQHSSCVRAAFRSARMSAVTSVQQGEILFNINVKMRSRI